MLRMALCDDSRADTEYLSALVQDWARETGTQAEMMCFDSAEALLFHYQEDKRFDILLLDIEMTGMDGVTLAKTVRRENELIQIVFVSGYSEYISEGYEVAALHYLLKPVSREKVFTVLTRAAAKVRGNERLLTLELAGEMVRIPLHEIRYLEVQQNYVTVHAKRDYVVKRTLSDFEPQLDNRFFRAGRAFIINLTLIRRVTKTEVYLEDGSVIPLPRGQYGPINRAIIEQV